MAPSHHFLVTSQPFLDGSSNFFFKFWIFLSTTQASSSSSSSSSYSRFSEPIILMMNFGAHWTLNTCNSQRECVPSALQFKILLLNFYFLIFCPMFELFSHLLTMRNVISFRRNLILTSSVKMLPCGQGDTIISEHKGPYSLFIHSFSFSCCLLWFKSYPSSCS